MRSQGELVLFGALLFGCNAGEDEVIASGTEGSSGASLGTDESGGDFCDTDPEPPIGGEWSEEVEDWHDAGQQGSKELIDGDPCGSLTLDDENVPSQIAAHHCFVTAVHAVHLPDGKLMLLHGEQDERVWQVGADVEDIDWHPLPFFAEHMNRRDNTENTQMDVCGGDPEWCWEEGRQLAQLFCSGHALVDGKPFFAGGNVDSDPQTGGIAETFLFDPYQASAASDLDPQCPFGWNVGDDDDTWTNFSPRMSYDRWYPTLTTLGTGQILISGGTSRVEDHTTVPPTLHAPELGAQTTRVLELYDPTASPPTIVPLDNEEALFPDGDGVPTYPYVFLLPNGDVFFAGAESTAAGQEDGYILVPDYGDVENWAFANVQINSIIPGGSAAMPRPGVIMKSGGGNEPTTTTEVVDLRGFPAGDYTGAPTVFDTVEPMNHARHFHTLTVLPDGRVAATGGNRWGNSGVQQGTGDGTGEHFENPCVYDGELRDCENGCSMESLDCEGGCPSVCINFAANLTVASDCSTGTEDLGCSLIRNVDCVPGTMGDMMCDEILDGAYCAASGPAANHCNRTCMNPGDDCGLVEDCAVESIAATGMCPFLNNACYATHAAEIYDPDCGTWTELGEQDYPRMYHSSALLLASGAVLSMGGGHRGGFQQLEDQPVSEYFEPDYAENPSAERPNFSFGLGGLAMPGGDIRPHLEWGNEGIDVVVNPTAEVVVDHASLIRLGSVTHGFDMEQRYLELPVTGSWPEYHVSPSSAAFHRNTAPPGWYMLFLVSEDGEPSVGQYIRVGDDTSPMFLCETSSEFTATEESCDEEPVQNNCPSGGEVSTPVDAPLVEGPMSTVNGFRVVVPAGVIADDDFVTLTANEVATVKALCARACDDYFASQLGQSANCDDPDAFETPVVVAERGQPTLDLIPEPKRNGWGLFVDQELECDLGTECWAEFDETLRMASPFRNTPASDMIAVGEEWSVTVSGGIEADSAQAVAPGVASITGTIGFSECTDTNASSPCAFYLGSMELSLTEPLLLELSCDGQPFVYELEELTLRLGQPAFGIAKEAQAVRGFPPGALILESEGVANEVPFSTRRPNQEKIYVVASAGWISMLGSYGAWLDVELPCPGEPAAEVDLWFEFNAVAWPGKPPSIEIDVPASVSCPDTVDLDYTASDNNNDIASMRWIVDGVLMDASVESLAFTDPHELTAIVRDSRGATRTDVETVTCQ